MPGTLTKVTPLMVEPMVARATMGHADCLPPTKKPALSARRPAM